MLNCSNKLCNIFEKKYLTDFREAYLFDLCNVIASEFKYLFIMQTF